METWKGLCRKRPQPNIDNIASSNSGRLEDKCEDPQGKSFSGPRFETRISEY